MCKLQCELLATAALFAHIHVLREKIFLFFFFDYGVTLCMQVASTAHSLVSLHRALPAGYLSVCIQKELFLRGLKGNSVAALQLFSARGINKSARFCSLGSGYWFLHKVMLVLSVKSKVASKLWKYCTRHSFYFKPDVLHGNWPKSDLSCCLLIQPQGNQVIFSVEFVLQVGFWIVSEGDLWAFCLWARWGPYM